MFADDQNDQSDHNEPTKTDVPSVLVPVGDGYEEWDVISRYTRADMLKDGALVDVSETAREAGIRFPVAVTRAVWNECVHLSDAAKRAGNDERGRLWDVVWMFRCEIVQNLTESCFLFEFYVVKDSIEPSLVTLKAECGPGDDGEPVLTILMPDED